MVQSYQEQRIDKGKQKNRLCLWASITRNAQESGVLGFPTALGFGELLGIWEADLGILYAIKGISMKPVLQVGCILLDRRCFAFKRYHLPLLESLYQTRLCS